MTVGFEDVVKVTVEGLGASGQDVQNVFHLQNTGSAITDADTIDDMVEVLESLYTLLAAVLSIVLIIRDIRVLNVTDAVDVGLGLFVDDTPGTNVLDVMPPQCSMGITLSTDRLKVRGRKFFGPTCDDQANNEGVVSAAALLDLADVGDHMTVEQVAVNSTWRYGVLASFDAVWLPFTGYVIPTTVVTQRRRRRGVGS